MRKLLFLFQSLFLLPAINHAFAIQANLPSYDLIPITPKTWQEVNLSYSDNIKGKNYPAKIKLLRPIEWLKENGMDKVGNHVDLSIPEFGVLDIHATVTAIKPTQLDTSKTDWSKMDSRPVIGTFKRYAPIVKTYTFKDVTTGGISTINATPNHPFYVKNKGKFIPIEDVAPTDQLVNSSEQTVKLICDKGKSSHCGKLYNTYGKPISVYNLEVYQRHVYYVGQNALLVHNNCNLRRSNSFTHINANDSRQSYYYFKNDYALTLKQKFLYRADVTPPETALIRGINDDTGAKHFGPEFVSHQIPASSDPAVAIKYMKPNFPGEKRYLYMIDVEGLEVADIDATIIFNKGKYNHYNLGYTEATEMHIRGPIPGYRISHIEPNWVIPHEKSRSGYLRYGDYSNSM